MSRVRLLTSEYLNKRRILFCGDNDDPRQDSLFQEQIDKRLEELSPKKRRPKSEQPDGGELQGLLKYWQNYFPNNISWRDIRDPASRRDAINRNERHWEWKISTLEEYIKCIKEGRDLPYDWSSNVDKIRDSMNRREKKSG